MPAITCEVCGKLASKICSACHNVSYCSSEHQKIHWKSGHKLSCRVYLIKKNEVMGRYMIAARDIPAGTVILDQAALVVGPKQDTLPICLGCYKRVDGSYLCSKCSLAVCNSSCEKAEIHSQNECKMFSSKKPIIVANYSVHHPLYQCILTVRCLFMKDRDPKGWERLHTMEHHNSIRKELIDLWTRNENNTVKFLREVYNLDFDPMTIHSILGYADINAFEIRAEGIEICGLFPDVALMAHDCISNTHHSITDDFRMIVRNVLPIKKGEMITTTYTYTLDGTLERRNHILDSKLFDCMCARCSSPTEIGTNFSSVKCPACPQGYVLSKDPLNPVSLWECSICHKPEKVEAIKSIVNSMRQEIESVESIRDNQIEKLESILQQNSNTKFHPQHFLMVSVMHTLSQTYGRMKGYTMPELTLEQLLRKEQLCRDLLKVLDILEPGLSRIRGLTMYELHAAIFFSAQKRFKNGEVSKDELKTLLEEVINLLKTSMEIMSFDSPLSATGKIASTIPESIEGVTEILKHFCSG